MCKLLSNRDAELETLSVDLLLCLGNMWRIITDSPYDAPAKPLLRQPRLPSIAEMIRQESASMVYKAINGEAPTYLYSLFNSISAVTNRMLRNSNSNLRPQE